MESPFAALLPDGRRLHLNHGPIDLIVEAFGPGRDAAYHQAIGRFGTVLDELAPQLEDLRRPSEDRPVLRGSIALRMQEAACAFLPRFSTPMIAVAGAVADEILECLAAVGGVEKAYVNNGGDTAFHLTPGRQMTAALAALPGGFMAIRCHHPYRGIATSGWRGRSLSLGIADSVTVVAVTAAIADTAATLIANAVDLPDHPAVRRKPACQLSPDSDLGERLITVDVGALAEGEKDEALTRGAALAEAMLSAGQIGGAVLTLGDRHRVIGLRDPDLGDPGLRDIGFTHASELEHA